MKKVRKKGLSLLLSLLMIFASVAIDASPKVCAAAVLRYPVSGYTSLSVSQPYLSSHKGNDLRGGTNNDALAAADGVVAQTYTYMGNTYNPNVWDKTQTSGGTRVAIYHADLGIYTLYFHLDALYVSQGQTVKAGDPIGSLGDTGYSEGVHLHFEICTSIHNYAYSDDGTTIDPGNYSYTFVSTPDPVSTTIPDAVTNLTSEKKVYSSSESVHFTWSPSAGATEYWVYLWKDGTQLYSFNCGSATSFTQAPSAEGNYTLIIRPGNSNGYNDSSPWYSYVVTNSVPAIPSIVDSDIDEFNVSDLIEIKWNNDRTASEYWVYLWKDGTEISHTTIFDETSYSFVPTENGKYTIYVRSGNSNGYSETAGKTYYVGSYTVFYNSNGGNSFTEKQKKIYGKQLLLTTEVPLKAGYVFNGWNTKSDGTGTDYASGEKYTTNASLTLYAQWTVNTYTVIFNTEGGDCPATSKTVTYGLPYGELPTPTRDGYTFNGWFTAADGGDQITADTTAIITENQTLYAHWTENHTHSYTPAVTAPTCMAGGFTTYTCSCGDSYVADEVAALGHDFDESIAANVTVVEPTATEDGSKTVKCSRCSETSVTVLPATGEEPVDPDAPQFVVSGGSARAGQTVQVTVSLANNPGIVATRLHLTYDPAVLTLTGVTDGGLIGTNTFTPGRDLTAIPFTVLWMDALSPVNYTENGVLVTYTFTVSEDAKPGTTPITLTYDTGSTYDFNLDDVSFAVQNDLVTVTDRTPGDANGDGVIDLKDVAIIRRSLASGWNVTVDEANADVNADKVVDLKDAAVLTRYLVGGWNVQLL